MIPEYVKNSGIEELNEQYRKQSLEARRTALNKMIDADINSEKDELRIKVLNTIRYLSSYSEEDLNAKIFVYNNGKFRTAEEIDAYNKKLERDAAWKRYNENMERNRQYYQSGQYKEDCKKGKFACWIPFLIDVGLFLIGLTDPYKCYDLIFWTVILSPVALLITLICIGIQSSHCEKLAREHNVPYNDPTYQKARDTSKSARLGLVAAAVGAYHSTSSAMKSISNPDTWNSI